MVTRQLCNWRTVGELLLALSLCVAALATSPVLNDQEKSIVAELKSLRGVPDDKRGEVTKGIALEIRRLPAGILKASLANNLANLATEGDFGHDTLQEVATTLAEALRERPSQETQPYLELAQLIRYEHVQVSLDSSQLAAAMSTLETYDRDRQLANFTLKDLKGKAWTLKDLRDHVVLVNFWATWCPPCRKEMPDLDALYLRYKDQGLVVLAISDEEAAKVSTFLATHHISYPILLDPGRKVNEQFHVEGIPKSFVYDRQGNLAAQAIDMRTQGQFLKLLNRAGLATSNDRSEN
jgi:peroxiredoxin